MRGVNRRGRRWLQAHSRHSRESGNPRQRKEIRWATWIPAFAGMTEKVSGPKAVGMRDMKEGVSSR
jgi:hypothetical protein